jgi:hypothetical protein
MPASHRYVIEAVAIAAPSANTPRPAPWSLAEQCVGVGGMTAVGLRRPRNPCAQIVQLEGDLEVAPQSRVRTVVR